MNTLSCNTGGSGSIVPQRSTFTLQDPMRKLHSQSSLLPASGVQVITAEVSLSSASVFWCLAYSPPTETRRSERSRAKWSCCCERLWRWRSASVISAVTSVSFTPSRQPESSRADRWARPASKSPHRHAHVHTGECVPHPFGSHCICVVVSREAQRWTHSLAITTT